MNNKYRIEHDFLGSVELPGHALYGANTVRGAQNFAISGRSFGQERAFVRAFAQIKMAAARANYEL
jgi:aspartate ammonia-lyase